jgi:tetratricopeptide (TPR) repeat protein
MIERGVALYPDNTDLIYQRALFLERAARHDEAMQVMKSLLALNPDNAEALNFLAYGLAEENRDLDEALSYAERAVKLKPAPHILDTLGWVYYRMGRLLEALKAIEQATLQLPDDAVVLEHLGDIHLALNNLEEARAAYTRALELQPENAGLHEKLEQLANQP